MNILIVGSGGREHALAWKAAQSDSADLVYVAPGNAGTQKEPKVENVAIGASDIPELLAFAKQHSVDMTIVGPEAPLAEGIADQFQAQGLAIIGPTQAAAQLESSKEFSKDFMRRHNIPTAAYRSFRDKREALDYLAACQFPIVVKADGLAAGKGVVIAENLSQATQAVETMLSGERFGAAGECVVIEDFLVGDELSFICLVDGEYALPLATSQDHKARDDGDLGPNTGGMGAYSPCPIGDEFEQTIMQKIIQPTVRGMYAEGNPFRGFLYVGLMMDQDKQPRVLEFNCRLGDPETQPILMRLRSDLLTLCRQLSDARLAETEVEWDRRAALGVVLAADNYPEDYQRGHIIEGLDVAEDKGVKVFHAGTGMQDGKVVTAGGRVLCVTALGDTLPSAQAKAYQSCEKISWSGMFYRRDIGSRRAVSVA